MKTFTSHKLLFTGLIYLLGFSSFNAQMMLKEISLEQQIQASTSVVEGEVLSKKSYWNTDYNNIYTVNTIKVFKVFKGQEHTIIEIITPGGTVNDMSQITRPSLQLRKKDIGVFTLHDASIKLVSNKVKGELYKPYSSVQGFYKYDLTRNIAINPFSKKQNIESSFYKEIQKYTRTDYKEIGKFNAAFEYAKSSQSKALLAPSNVTFSPSEISAGTASELTINGDDFGVIKGKVSFKSTKDGGSTYIEAFDSQVTWSLTQIKVEVPSFAGTGTLRVTDNNGDFSESSTDLIVTYALINETDTDNGFEYPLQAYGVNGSGGFTWNKNTAFVTNTAADAAFTRALDSWRCETGINWIIGSQTSTSTAASDSENVISFEALPPGNLGVTTTYTNSCNSGTNWYLEEVDMVFDDPSTTTWNFGPDPTGFAYDFESTALHELGHAHLLDHVIDNNDIMDFNLGPATDLRELATRNITAANIIQTRNTTNIICALPLMANYNCPINSVEDEELKNAINIYPNPTTGQIFIKNGESIKLDKAVIYDVSGRLILNVDLSNSSNTQIINLRGASKGMYFINIHSERGTATKKLILE